MPGAGGFGGYPEYLPRLPNLASPQWQPFFLEFELVGEGVVFLFTFHIHFCEMTLRPLMPEALKGTKFSQR
jgi:hypothetical protein